MIEIAAEGGYEAVTVRKLTKLAGISTGSFYSQFDGKEEAFVDAYAGVMESIRRQVAATRSTSSSRHRQLASALRVLVGRSSIDADSRRLALVEISGGGPAALSRVRSEETMLDSVLKECLDRRDARISLPIVSWIVAGSLHISRARVLEGQPAVPPETLDSLARWGATYLDEEAPDLSRRGLVRPSRSGAAESLGAVSGAVADQSAMDRELILNAALKLATKDSYWGLSKTAIRKAAGVPTARFGREFRGIEDCYLAAMRKLSDQYCAHLRRHRSLGAGDVDWARCVYESVSSLCDEIVADVARAELLFIGVVDPGLEGLRCREDLIGDWARVWREISPGGTQLSSEATMAALWSAIAQKISCGHGAELGTEAATFAYLLLAPRLGVDEAAVVVEQAILDSGDRSPLTAAAAV